MEIKTDIKGFKEIKEFLDEKNIKYTINTQESFEDINVIIEIVKSSITLITLIIELKRWLSNKKKTNPEVIIINNSKINITSDSEEDIRKKLS